MGRKSLREGDAPAPRCRPRKRLTDTAPVNDVHPRTDSPAAGGKVGRKRKQVTLIMNVDADEEVVPAPKRIKTEISDPRYESVKIASEPVEAQVRLRDSWG